MEYLVVKVSPIKGPFVFLVYKSCKQRAVQAVPQHQLAIHYLKEELLGNAQRRFLVMKRPGFGLLISENDPKTSTRIVRDIRRMRIIDRLIYHDC